MKTNRAETRLAVSKATRTALRALGDRNQIHSEPEAFDTLIRRMILTVTRSGGLQPNEDLSTQDRAWIVNEEELPSEVARAMELVNEYMYPVR
jgi:hypothetical protein|tara:strand:- start:868 stop:1146 length:279 start_codon:yes stop_codon:yes gene_type:complete